MNKKRKISWFFLGAILVIALILRLYKINLPLADHHSWRQADTAAVARNFIKEGFDFFRPRIDNMTPLHSPDLPNPERLFLAEPPIYNSLVALVYSFFGVKESFARALSILFSLGSIIFLFLLVKDSHNHKVALWAALFFAILPFSVFYSRVVLPEPLMVFATLGMLYFFKRFLAMKTWPSFFLALIFTALSLSQKAFPFFLGLPMLYLLFKKWRFSFFLKKKLIFSLLLFVFLSGLPIILWRLWIARFPEGIPPFDWLFNQGNIRFRPAFFRWIFIERIGKLILGCWGLVLFSLGLILAPPKKTGWFYHFWFLSFLIYVSVLASGNVTHDYYQIPFIPIAAVFLGIGADFLSSSPGRLFSKINSRLILLTCLTLMIGFSWYQVKDFYSLQGGVDLAGRAVDLLTPKNALILTGDSNDATLLYNTNRHGWTGGYASYFPNIAASVEKARVLGAEFYVTTKIADFPDSDFARFMIENFEVLTQTNQYILFDLR
jgi:4-amino-4-deoxy-L-arabinose transferase-like glycosyltransferase